jgi:putative serine protease PepD
VAAAVAAAAVALAGGAAGAGTVLAADRSRPAASAAGTSVPVRTVGNEKTTTIADVVAAVDPQVVSLSVTGQGSADQGSGVVIRSDGLILTNNHVISAAAGGGTVTVTFTNGRTAGATVVAADAAEDLALVQASGVSALPVATFGNSDALRIGDTVIAIGNELGLSNSVSAGIVSALHRKVTVSEGNSSPFTRSGGRSTTYGDAIQTDAAINQGDSGGALFNTAGQVVGIDSAIATATGGGSGSVGIGFAIASNDVTAFIARALHG